MKLHSWSHAFPRRWVEWWRFVDFLDRQSCKSKRYQHLRRWPRIRSHCPPICDEMHRPSATFFPEGTPSPFSEQPPRGSNDELSDSQARFFAGIPVNVSVFSMGNTNQEVQVAILIEGTASIRLRESNSQDIDYAVAQWHEYCVEYIRKAWDASGYDTASSNKKIKNSCQVFTTCRLDCRDWQKLERGLGKSLQFGSMNEFHRWKSKEFDSLCRGQMCNPTLQSPVRFDTERMEQK